MLRILVLGAAAGGGFPQWNCNCPACRRARAGDAQAVPSGQASVAVSGDGERWFVLNAAPELREQINATPALHPKGALRHSPVAGVILTNGEIDAVTGLLSMREGSPFAIYAHAKVLAILKSNSIFDVLNERTVRREAIDVDRPFEPELADGSPSGLEIEPFAVAGTSAWYLRGKAHPGGTDGTGDTLGLKVTEKASGKHFYFLAACAGLSEDLKSRLAGAPLVFFDGTVWRDDEMIAQGLGQKTGKAMGHIAMSGDDGAIAQLAGVAIDRKVFLHINNSNPALLAASPERKMAEHAGWQIPADGTEIVL